MDDLISRQDAIDALDGKIKLSKSEVPYFNKYLRDVIERIKELPSVAIPSAEPKIVPIAEIKFDDDMLHEIVEKAVKNIEIEPNWIPVSERLPEDDGEYLATIYDTDENYKYMDIAEWEDGIWQYKDYIKVLAWMPLPKPFEPQESEDKE